MLEIKLNDGTVKKFNLKSFEKEKNLQRDWYLLSEEKKNRDKKIKISILGLTFRIGDIKTCKFDESIFAQGVVR